MDFLVELLSDHAKSMIDFDAQRFDKTRAEVLESAFASLKQGTLMLDLYESDPCIEPAIINVQGKSVSLVFALESAVYAYCADIRQEKQKTDLLEIVKARRGA